MDRQRVRAGFALALFLTLMFGWVPFLWGADDEASGLTEVAAPAYKFDRQTAAFRTGIAVVDTAATTASDSNLALTPEFGLLGRSNLAVSARFSAAAQSCKVRVVTCWKPSPSVATYVVLGISDEVTLTASGVQRSSRYVAPTYVFDGAGAYSAFVIVTDPPASGTLDLWVGSF